MSHPTNIRLARFAAAVRIRNRLRAMVTPEPASHLDDDEHAAILRAWKQVERRIEDLRGYRSDGTVP